MKVCRIVPLMLAVLVPIVLGAGCGRGGSGKENLPEPERVVSVEVEEAAAGRVEDWLDLPGKIEPFREVTVSAEVEGILEDLRAEEGTEVTRGQTLAVIDRENLELRERQALLALEQARIGVGQARIGVEQARAAKESAAAGKRQAEATHAQAVELAKKAGALMEESTRDRDRGRALFDEQLAPRSRLEDLETAVEAAARDLASATEGVKASAAGVEVAAAAGETAAAGLKAAEERLALSLSMEKTAEASLDQARLFLRKSTIRSPLDGIVDLSSKEEGELVKAQDALMRIVQTQPVKAVFHLPEQDVPYLTVGMKAEVTVDALSPVPLAGSVAHVGVTSDPATSTYRLEVDLPNDDGSLKPGMLARLRLLRQGVDESVTAPVFAVITEGKDSFVMLYEEGVARRREVTTGIVDGNRVEITSGLEAGEFLIVKGQRALEDGQRVALP